MIWRGYFEPMWLPPLSHRARVEPEIAPFQVETHIIGSTSPSKSRPKRMLGNFLPRVLSLRLLHNFWIARTAVIRPVP